VKVTVNPAVSFNDSDINNNDNRIAADCLRRSYYRMSRVGEIQQLASLSLQNSAARPQQPGDCLISPSDSELFNDWMRHDPASKYRRQSSIAAIKVFGV